MSTDPIIRVKRSIVPGKVPTLSQLGLGEIALNHYDGKLFIRQDTQGVGIASTVIAVNPWNVSEGSNYYNTYFTVGNVGIGTTNPTSKLTISGDVNVTGVVTASSFSGNATSATYATSSGITTSVVGGIASVTSLNVSGVSTLGTVQVSSGIITATTGIITYYGDGSKLSGISAQGSISISTNTTNSYQLVPYAISTGNTTGLGVTNSFVFNPSTGNLGIGVTNPQVKLQVGGVLGFNSDNIRIGDNKTGCSITSGSNNFFAGSYAGRNTNSGSSNNFIGFQAGAYNTNGSANNFLGLFAGQNNTTGCYNNFFGFQSGIPNTTGSCNNFFGNQSGPSNTIGNLNNFIGFLAGAYNTTGSNNIALGNLSGSNSSDLSNKILIGNGFYDGNFYFFDSPDINKDTQFAVGVRTDSNPEKYWLVGNENFNIGIGTTNATSKLHVGGDVLVSGVVTASSFSGNATSATYATSSGIATSVLTNPGVGIATAGGTVGTGATILDFRGSGISTVTVASGIATINITGGGGGGTIAITDDTITNATYYVGIANTTTGNLSTLNVSSTRLTFNPSTGNLVAGGTVTANSDEKLKTNIKTIENALDKVLSLRGVEFDRIDTNEHQIGVIAQEVEKIIPEVVYPRKGAAPNYEVKSVAYANMIGLLIEAIKEQNQKIAELERKLEEK